MAIPPVVMKINSGHFVHEETAYNNEVPVVPTPNNGTKSVSEQHMTDEPYSGTPETCLSSAEKTLPTPLERADALIVMEGNTNLANNSHPNRRTVQKTSQKGEKRSSSVPNMTTKARSADTDPLPSQSGKSSNQTPQNKDVTQMENKGQKNEEAGPPVEASNYVSMPSSEPMQEDPLSQSPDTFGLMDIGTAILKGAHRWINAKTSSSSAPPNNRGAMDAQPAVDNIDDSIKASDTTAKTNLPTPAPKNGAPNDSPTFQPVVAIYQPTDSLDPSTWPGSPPVISGSLTTVPYHHPLAGTCSVAMEKTSREKFEGGYTLDKTVQTGFQGNPELLQSGANAMVALQTKPSGTTFSVTTAKGQKKEYYRAQFTLSDLIAAGRSLATGCKYADDVTVSVEKYNEANDIAYACITFRKRMDHAQKTYRELCQRWGVQVQKPLTFATPLGIFGSFMSADTPKAIQLLEQERTRVFQDFVVACYEGDVPNDPAFQAIYRPTHDERRLFLGDCPEYIAATDCVMFIYKPVPNKGRNTHSSESKS